MTHPDHEAAVLSALRETHGYFTIYWAMETQYRIAAMERLLARGVIRYDQEHAFPLCHVEIRA